VARGTHARAGAREPRATKRASARGSLHHHNAGTNQLEPSANIGTSVNVVTNRASKIIDLEDSLSKDTVHGANGLETRKQNQNSDSPLSPVSTAKSHNARGLRLTH